MRTVSQRMDHADKQRAQRAIFKALVELRDKIEFECDGVHFGADAELAMLLEDLDEYRRRWPTNRSVTK